MSAVRGAVVAVLSLTALDVLLGTAQAKAIGGAFAFIAAGINRWIDPALPLIPDLRLNGSTSTATALDTTPNPTATPLPTTAAGKPIPA